MKPVIKKIEFTKEEQEEIDKISKGIPVPKVRIFTNKNGYTYEYTSNKRFTFEMGRKRLLQLHGGLCRCGQWPNYKVMVDVGDKNQGAWLVSRFCQSCYDKQPIKQGGNK